MNLDAQMEEWTRLDADHRQDIQTRRPVKLHWYYSTALIPGQHTWKKRGRYQLTVIWSIGPHDEGRWPGTQDWWLHVSCARPDVVPTHEQMAEVKELFVGPDRWAYSVWAPADSHINIHERALHLWAPIDNVARLPDFGRYGTI
jgi:hypothetical protein